jgi:tRNA 2-thiocytidine biosynthesis protein TtcA
MSEASANTEFRENQYSKLSKKLRTNVGKAVVDFNMIENNDKLMVCLSGGKDSYTMLDMLIELRKRAPVSFDLLAVNLDQKQPDYPEHILPEYLEALNVPYHVIERDTYSVVTRVIPAGKTMCGLCSRLRRGTLYGFAEENQITKIALGHHRDDILETLFLNMFHGGTLSAMPPWLRSDDGKNIVIRPMAYCREQDIEDYSTYRNFPIIPCNLCGSQENMQRQEMKKMLRDWETRFPGRVENIFRSIQNIKPSQLADRKIYPFSKHNNDDA